LFRSQASDGTLQAVVVFESPTAAKTALLLNSALINERPINVQPANLESEQRAKADKKTTILNKTNLPPPEQRSKTSVIASILAAGYKLSHDALEKAKQYDESIGLTETIKQKVQQGVNKVKEVDEKLGVSTKAKELGGKVNQTITELDQKLGVTNTVSFVAETTNQFVMGVTQRVTAAVDTVTDKALKYVESNQTVQAGVQKVKQFQESVAHTVNQIKEETQQLIAQQQQQQQQQQQPQPQSSTESELQTPQIQQQVEVKTSPTPQP
jgi:Ni,Fe-hydrogenase maturation factor